MNDARGVARYCGATYYWPAKALEWDDRLCRAATSHAQDMAARGYFSHQLPPPGSTDPCERSRAHGWTGHGWTGRLACAENIAAGQTTVRQVMDGLLASPGHCANIMSPDSAKLGVGTATGGRHGKYWVQHFGPPEGPGANVTTIP